MQARGPLMIEHRLIERMIELLRRTLAEIKSGSRADPLFIDTAVDFMRMYADRTHHGKEEDILFRELEERPLSAADRKMMDELVEEHIFARRNTKALVEANTRNKEGDAEASFEIAERLQSLVDFYPRHIEKEDKIFFPASRAYFSDEEEQKILARFWEFDRKMIHEKYKAVVDTIERSAR